MKLVKKPMGIKNMFGGTTISDAYIWSPSDGAGKVFEKLRTGKTERFGIGMKFNHIVFDTEGITLYDVQVVESFSDDTYRCSVDKFSNHRKETNE